MVLGDFKFPCFWSPSVLFEVFILKTPASVYHSLNHLQLLSSERAPGAAQAALLYPLLCTKHFGLDSHLRSTHLPGD